jgi:transposase InsO family protein
MKTVLVLVVHLLASVAMCLGPGGARAVVAENLLLKHQLLILSRSRQRAPNLYAGDRFLLGLCSLFLRTSRLEKVAAGLRASTLLNFHQCLVRCKYRVLFTPKSRNKPGPKGPSAELIHAIVELKRRNPRFGCPRIALIITNTFGIDIDKNVVRRVLAKHYQPEPGDGPSWLAFLGHTKDSLWSIDLFRCESVLLRRHWVLVVMDQFTRRIIGFGVHAGDVDGPTLCRLFNQTIAGSTLPRRISTDHDPLFEFHRWKANLRILEIDEVKTVPYVPLSHPFIERLIGSVRREFLDHVLFWNCLDLERKLTALKNYYNDARVHASLDGNTPTEAGGKSTTRRADISHITWKSHCHGLVQLPIAA